MPDHIRIRPAPGTWTIRAAGAVLGESNQALELTEGSYPSVIYFPRDNLAMALFDQSDTTSTCPWKGDATYFSINTGSGALKDAAWSYEAPIDDVSEIAGRGSYSFRQIRRCDGRRNLSTHKDFIFFQVLWGVRGAKPPAWRRAERAAQYQQNIPTDALLPPPTPAPG